MGGRIPREKYGAFRKDLAEDALAQPFHLSHCQYSDGEVEMVDTD